jgi:hypothetical protein
MTDPAPPTARVRPLTAYLLLGIAFPALAIALISLWKLPILGLIALHAPVAAANVARLAGGLASLVGAGWLCRIVWRSQRI